MADGTFATELTTAALGKMRVVPVRLVLVPPLLDQRVTLLAECTRKGQVERTTLIEDIHADHFLGDRLHILLQPCELGAGDVVRLIPRPRFGLHVGERWTVLFEPVPHVS
jgi:hypothetical protein